MESEHFSEFARDVLRDFWGHGDFIIVACYAWEGFVCFMPCDRLATKLAVMSQTFVGISSPMKTTQVGGMKNLRLREARRLHLMRLPEV